MSSDDPRERAPSSEASGVAGRCCVGNNEYINGDSLETTTSKKRVAESEVKESEEGNDMTGENPLMKKRKVVAQHNINGSTTVESDKSSDPATVEEEKVKDETNNNSYNNNGKGTGSIFGSGTLFSGFGALKSQPEPFGGYFGSSGGGFGAFKASNSSGNASETLEFSFRKDKSHGFFTGSGSSALLKSSVVEKDSTATDESTPTDRSWMGFGSTSDSAQTADKQQPLSDDRNIPETTTDGTGPVNQSPAKGPSILPTDYKPESGEENEILLMECRCKTYRWGSNATSVEADDPSPNPASSPSVPPTDPSTGASLLQSIGEHASKDAPPANPTKDDDQVQKNGQLQDDNRDSKDESTNAAIAINTSFDMTKESSLSHDDDEKKNISNMTWHEVGVGPVRVLRSKDTPPSVRLVQRRQVHQTTPTKVLLNVRLFSESTVTQPGDCHVRFVTPAENGKANTFLFKCGKAHQAQALFALLKSEIQNSSVSRFQAGNTENKPAKE